MLPAPTFSLGEKCFRPVTTHFRSQEIDCHRARARLPACSLSQVECLCSAAILSSLETRLRYTGDDNRRRHPDHQCIVMDQGGKIPVKGSTQFVVKVAYTYRLTQECGAKFVIVNLGDRGRQERLSLADEEAASEHPSACLVGSTCQRQRTRCSILYDRRHAGGDVQG